MNKKNTQKHTAQILGLIRAKKTTQTAHSLQQALGTKDSKTSWSSLKSGTILVP